MQVTIKIKYLFFFFITLLSESISAADPCSPVYRRRDADGEAFEVFSIDRPGPHCLAEDIKSHRVFAFAEGGERGGDGFIGYITTSGVNLDMRGHVLFADAIGVGGLEDSGPNGFVSNVAIRNGVIKSRTNRGVQFNSAFGWNLATTKDDFFQTSRRLPELKPINELDYREFLALKKELKVKFPITAHRIENLKISAVYRPLEIRGAGNVIKGSRFESTVHSIGLDLSGPNQVVEGNTIVVQAEPGKGAAIVLNMADNSVIRNNTIVIEGGGDHPNAAISIVDSKNVLIENNKIIGARVLFKVWDETADQNSTVIQRGNDFPTFWDRLLGR